MREREKKMFFFTLRLIASPLLPLAQFTHWPFTICSPWTLWSLSIKLHSILLLFCVYGIWSNDCQSIYINNDSHRTFYVYFGSFFMHQIQLTKMRSFSLFFWGSLQWLFEDQETFFFYSFSLFNLIENVYNIFRFTSLA